MAKVKMLRVKLSNLENRGKGIMVPVNGENYYYPDGYEGEVPEQVVEALKDAVETRYVAKDLNIDKGETATSFQNRRFLVVYLDAQEADSKEKAVLKAENEELKAKLEELNGKK